MTAPNPAATAQPGWRGTDPNGGTWVRLDREDLWFEILAAGRGSYRSQEEAEAAGLVPLVPAWSEALRSRFSARPHLTITDLKFDPAPLEQWKRDVLSAAEVCAVDEPGPHIVETGGYRLRIDRADYPAPLDPGNPEHLRRWIKDTNALFDGAESDYLHDALDSACNAVGSMIRKLDREAREAEQDAADRKRAEEIAKTEKHDFGLLAESYREEIVRHILAGIRAGRAERQEAEEPGRVCCCGAMRVPGGELSVTDMDTVHRVGGPCYVDEERAS